MYMRMLLQQPSDATTQLSFWSLQTALRHSEKVLLSDGYVDASWKGKSALNVINASAQGRLGYCCC